MLDDRSEKQWQRKVRNREKQRQMRLDDFVRAAMQHQSGREYFWHLLEISGLNRNPHTANALNTAFQCGEMNIGQQVQAHIVKVAPKDFLNMLSEKEEERLNGGRPDEPSEPDTDDFT